MLYSTELLNINHNLSRRDMKVLTGRFSLSWSRVVVADVVHAEL